MGTSQSSTGPGSGSPLVPPWADDQPQTPLPPSEPARFKGFRQSLGRFISNGDQNDLQRAIGHYARKATGGSGVARRMGSVSKAGGRLFGTLSGIPAGPGEKSVNLDSLSGLPCELAISAITNALTSEDGDSDKIRTAMNHALVEALDGIEVFDPKSITDDVIVDTMICYLSESVFLQIVSDGGKAWNKAETPIQTMRAETELQELIKVVVDKKMAPKLTGNIRSFSREQMVQIERQTVIDVWKEWEAYQ
jgi:hypothetical protein